jgi:hypothetical protein
MTEALRRLVMDPVLVAIVVGKRAGNFKRDCSFL